MRNQDILSFETVSEPHIPLLFSWLNSSHLKGIYDNGYASQRDVAAKYLEEQKDVRRFIVCSQGQPFGYIQAYDVEASHAYAKYRRSEGVTVGIDLFIGETHFLGKGYGHLMLEQFIAFLGRRVDRVIVDPKDGNLSEAMFQKYGFKELGEMTTREGSHRILAIDIRYTARALIMNKEQQLLLMKVEDDITVDNNRPDNHFWVTIGGTIEKHEDEIQAVAREVREETGMVNFDVGELVFYGEHTLLFYGFPVRHFEKFYFVHVNDEKIHQENLTENEKSIFRDIRWWSLQELLTTQEVYYPRSLAKELKNALKGTEIPKEIIL